MSHILRTSGPSHQRVRQPRILFKTKGVLQSYEEQHVLKPGQVDTAWGPVTQHAPTVKGRCLGMPGYQPARDCNGNFMPHKYQAFNNSYNYSVIIATNTFAQPGRAGNGTNFYKSDRGISRELIRNNAERDGLEDAGRNLDDMRNFENDVRKGRRGHYVALLFSEPGTCGPGLNWPGDFHWLRLDTYTFNSRNGFSNMSWSQKDGADEITQFDSAVIPITNPMNANFITLVRNEGTSITIKYTFYCFMFVPHGSNGVPTPNII